MKKVEILSACVCAGRNLNAGTMLDVDAIRPGDLAILEGSGLARVVDRYEIPESDLKPVNNDPRAVKPAVKRTVKRKRK